MHTRRSIPGQRKDRYCHIHRTLDPPLHGEMHAGQAVTNGLSMIENLAVAQLKKYRRQEFHEEISQDDQDEYVKLHCYVHDLQSIGCFDIFAKTSQLCAFIFEPIRRYPGYPASPESSGKLFYRFTYLHLRT